MLQAKDACYVLVRTTTEGFDLYQRLVDAGVPVRVVPAPHGMQACCGASVLLDPEVVDAARPVIEAAPYPIERIVRVAGAINPVRDTYCWRLTALRPATLNARPPIVREFGLAHSRFGECANPYSRMEN